MNQFNGSAINQREFRQFLLGKTHSHFCCVILRQRRPLGLVDQYLHVAEEVWVASCALVKDAEVCNTTASTSRCCRDEKFEKMAVMLYRSYDMRVAGLDALKVTIAGTPARSKILPLVPPDPRTFFSHYSCPHAWGCEWAFSLHSSVCGIKSTVGIP